MKENIIDLGDKNLEIIIKNIEREIRYQTSCLFCDGRSNMETLDNLDRLFSLMCKMQQSIGSGGKEE